MLHPIILLFAFVEYRDDTMKNASIWNFFIYSAGILCLFI